MHDSKLAVVAQWLARGWALVPLHDVSCGHCSCRYGATCTSAGKHPVADRGWQDESQLVRDLTVLQAIHGAHPEWNWGVATGRPSGIWVLDIDGAEGAASLAALVAGRESLNTLTLGPTGGGGWHLIFELPPDFEPRNSAGRLGKALDVRGWHGQIVVAPSVSGKGPYGGVMVDAPVRRAPAWLEDMLRPQPVERVVEKASRAAVDQAVVGDPRSFAYAKRAVDSELADLANAADGTRDTVSIKVALRLVEIGNAPWSGYSLDALEDAWTEVRMSIADHSRVAATLPAKWRRATVQIGGRAAYLPPGALGGEHVPIIGAGGPVVVPDFPAAGALPLLDPGVPAGDGTVVGASSGQAALRVPSAFVQAMRSRLLTAKQLRDIPLPQPLINGLLDLDTCAWLIGKPGSCKSFLALDLAVHVGRGEAWRGRRTHTGKVVYVAAEGARGIRLRVDAIERELIATGMDGDVRNVVFLPELVPANERDTPELGAWSVLAEVCRLEQPVLIIIDTQARVTIGLNENDNGDMGYYVEQVERLRRATGACVLTVHHMGRSGTNARGASAIDGAQDTELRIERASADAMVLKLHMDKQKDQAATEPIEMALRLSPGGIDQDTGRDLSSLVIMRQDDLRGLEPLESTGPEGRQTRGQRRMTALYKLIVDRFNEGEGGTRSEIKKAFLALPELEGLKADSKDREWARAWNGNAECPGLIPRRLILRRSGADRFKVLIMQDQSSGGVLTPNPLENPTLPPSGWELHLKDYD